MKDNSSQFNELEMPLNKDLQNILHPYIFVLKEGEGIHNDLLDYTLMMLNVSPPETIYSPGSERIMTLLPSTLTHLTATDNSEHSAST